MGYISPDINASTEYQTQQLDPLTTNLQAQLVAKVEVDCIPVLNPSTIMTTSDIQYSMGWIKQPFDDNQIINPTLEHESPEIQYTPLPFSNAISNAANPPKIDIVLPPMLRAPGINEGL